jgi:glutamine synthetase
LEWAQDNSASVYCHTFQPIGSDGVRHGHTAELQNGMFKINDKGELNWSFTGNDLLQGETDGSSYSTGGLRQTHNAGAYVRVNAMSSVYLRGDTVHIPAVFFSHDNNALDEKIPLLRSLQSLSQHGTKLLRLLGLETKGVDSRIGLEQEFFFVPKAAYDRRLDLQLTGRTLLGKPSPRGQEMCDHYMGTPVENGAALACLKDVQSHCYELGIPIKTRHLEVAPGQYEFAPLFGAACIQIDQNLLFMQVLRETALKHNLVALMHEKPFSVSSTAVSYNCLHMYLVF